MLAEALAARALGIEAVEDALQLGVGNAGPLILDDDLHLAHRLARAQPDMAMVGAEGDGVAQQVAQHLHQAILHAHRHQLFRRFQLHLRIARLARRVVQLHQHGEDGADIHRLRHGARQLGIHARGIRDVADQSVHPHRIIGDDAEQPLLLRRVLHAAQRLDGAAHAGQWILQLMRHIGGEALIGVNARPERAGGGLQVARQDADLVLPLQQALGHAAAAALALAHLGRGTGELQDRIGEGARQVERDGDGEDQRQHEEAEHAGADLEQPRIHLPRLARQQHDAHGLRAAPRGLGHADQQAAIRRAADIGGHAALEREAQLRLSLGAEIGLPVEALRIGRRVQHHGVQRLARQQAQHALIEARDGIGERATRGWRRQRLGHHGAAHRLAHAAIGDDEARRVEEPRLGVGRGFHEAAQQRPRDFGHQHGAVILDAHRGLGDAARIDARLGAHRLDLGAEQPVLVLVEVEQGGRQQRGRQRIHQQDAPQQGRDPAAAALAVILPVLGLEQRGFGHAQNPVISTSSALVMSS